MSVFPFLCDVNPGLLAAWAAWVQAIGSVVAIFATWWLTTKQISAERQLLRDQVADERQRRLGSILELATALYAHLKLAHERVFSGTAEEAERVAASGLEQRQVRNRLTPLQGIPLHTMPVFGIAHHVTELITSAEDAVVLWDALGAAKLTLGYDEARKLSGAYVSAAEAMVGNLSQRTKPSPLGASERKA